MPNHIIGLIPHIAPVVALFSAHTHIHRGHASSLAHFIRLTTLDSNRAAAVLKTRHPKMAVAGVVAMALHALTILICYAESDVIIPHLHCANVHPTVLDRATKGHPVLVV